MKSSVLALVACSLIAATLCAAPPAPGFRASAATSIITPPLGRPIVGNFIAPLSTNVHDELHARCLVLDDGKTEARPGGPRSARHRGGHVHRGAEPDREAGRDSVGQRADLRRAYPFSQQHGGKAPAPGEPQYENYRAFVVQRIVDGVRCAANRLRPAQLACLTTQATEHVFNRRWFLKPGTMPPNPFGGIDQVKMNPPGGSPDLMKPAGPTDPR